MDKYHLLVYNNGEMQTYTLINNTQSIHFKLDFAESSYRTLVQNDTMYINKSEVIALYP